jgi:hypothetical protein
MTVFDTYKDRPKRGRVINESFNFRPKTQKSIKDELKKNGVPDDWFPFLRDVFLSFSDNKDVMAFEINAIAKGKKVSGSTLGLKIRPDEFYKVLSDEKYRNKKFKGFKVTVSSGKTPRIELAKSYGDWDFSIDLKSGAGSDAAKGPTGAQWESLITHQVNDIKGNDDDDPKAKKEAMKFYPVYYQQAKDMGQAFIKELGLSSSMTQFGASSGKLSSFWTKNGGSNATPKTDMFTSNYNISLKKAGGSQLASGAVGETLATFHAALAYMGEGGDTKKIKKIMERIKNSFHKVMLDYNKGELDDLEAGKTVKGSYKKGSKIFTKGKGNKPDKAWGKKDQDEFKKFKDTEAFHKTLNADMKDDLSFGNEPEFRKWFVFEAMSGYKKFSGAQSTASICVTFNPDTAGISSIMVTSDGKAKGLSGNPKPSKGVISKAKSTRIYAAYKSSGNKPYSTIRAGHDYTTDQEWLVDCTLDSIIRDEILLDEDVKSLGLNLTEEIIELDEFALLKSVYKKLKNVGKDAAKWITGFFKKVMEQVSKTLDAIQKLGGRMFEALFQFLGIEISNVTSSFDSEIKDFANK